MKIMYRSEKMAFCQLILQNEASFNCMAQIGELGLIQFKDLNRKKSVFKKKYIGEVKRCEKLEKILMYFKKELERNAIEIPEDSNTYPAANHRVLSEYEGRLESMEKEVRGIDDRLNQLSKNYIDLVELKHLLRKTDSFFDEVDRRYDHIHDPVTHIQVADSNNNSGGEQESNFLIPIDTPPRHDDDASTNHYINSFKLKFIGGVLAREKLEYFERMLFRACHGNTLLKYADVDVIMPSFLAGSQEASMHKTIFLVFFQGEQLQAKVQKICEGFHASIYPCPESQVERREMSMGVMTRLEDLNLVLNQTQEYLYGVLLNLSKQIRQWSISIRKTKQIYHQLNMLHFDKNLKTLFGKCWAPVRDLDRIHAALLNAASDSQSNESSVIFHQIPTLDTPPTYHKTNKFTKVTQDIIDAYSVPAYLEVNPAIFSVVTFPFLFSVMFGDIGHGILLALFGLFLVKADFPDKLKKNEMFRMIYGGRYMIFLMGIFSVYSGFLYNDCFSLPFNFFGSSWSARNLSDAALRDEHIGLDPARRDHLPGGNNIFGMDPVWQLAHNKISWLNSFKMKISVIFGVCHMMFGVLIGLSNHRFFGHRLDIVAEFIPQVIFMMSTFGYLVLLVVYKWLAYDATQSNVAPSLLIGFINMFLMSYPSEPPSAVVSPFRETLQIILLLSALVCVPWMLLMKPIVLKRRQDRLYRFSRNRSLNHNNEEYISLLNTNADSTEVLNDSGDEEAWVNSTEYDFNSSASDDDDEEDVLLDKTMFNKNNNNNKTFSPKKQSDTNTLGSDQVFTVLESDSVSTLGSGQMRRKKKKHSEDFNFGEVMVTQAIHTIEYCLGCISHTASYLRLWALSLAHAQLSEVLWKMVLHLGFTAAGQSYSGAIVLFMVFAPWAMATTVVLLLMEGLSAFLHTLRLHWIEFMSKFFKGEGHAFRPFSFHDIDVAVDSEDVVS